MEWLGQPLRFLHGRSECSYFLLHDGRAKSIEEAIELHSGEAHNSREKFEQLSNQDKESLIKFLESL